MHQFDEELYGSRLDHEIDLVMILKHYGRFNLLDSLRLMQLKGAIKYKHSCTNS
jgi:hypothetical protein